MNKVTYDGVGDILSILLSKKPIKRMLRSMGQS
jgi:hypothetical protein